MKNQSRFAMFTAMAVAAISSMASDMQNMVRRETVYYRSRRTATARPDNNPAGTKLLNAARAGTLGLGIHGNGKAVGGKVTFSPKKDIGKGPARTLPVGRKQKASHFQRMQLRDVHLG